MKNFEPFSRLYKKADSTRLKSSVSVLIPANTNLAETKFAETSSLSTIEYTAESSDYDSASRVVNMVKEFDWNGVDRNVSTEVFDLNGTSGGKNVINTSQAQIY